MLHLQQLSVLSSPILLICVSPRTPLFGMSSTSLFIMRLQSLALTSFAVTVAAQAQSNQSLVAALESQPALSNLSTYLSLYPSFLSTLEGLTNITLLAPNNDAFELALNSDQGAPSNNDLVSAIFSYHVLNGTYSNFSTNATFIPTALLPGAYANVTGGQVVEAIGATDQTTSSATFYSGLLQNSTTVQGMTSNSTNSTNSTSESSSPYTTTFAGGVIHIIDHFLVLPNNLTNTAVQINLQSAVGALQVTNLSQPLDLMSDVTVFLPDNAAFQAVGASIATSSIADLTRILEYHVVNGSVLYSTSLMNGSTLTAMNGIGLDITMEDGDIFVNSAKVLTPNVLVGNGVVHVIDNVLNPGNRTAVPNTSASTQAPAFTDASSASDVPFTSGVATATSSIYTEGPSSATSAAATSPTPSSSNIAAPRQTGAMAAAALFGGAAAIMNM